MGRISGTTCFILVLLTVLSIAPAALLFLAYEFSPEGLVRGAGRFLISPDGICKRAVVALFGPILVLLAYVHAFIRYHKQRDITERAGRPLR